MIFFKFLFIMIAIIDMIGIAGLTIVFLEPYLLKYVPSCSEKPTE